MDSPSVIRRFLPVIILALVGTILAALLVPLEREAVREHLAGFPDSHVFAHHLRPLVLAGICFIPAMVALYYCLVKALDRYLIKQFVRAFFLCFSALYGIWLIVDLTNHISDFGESDSGLSLMGKYYLITFPLAFVELAPFALLLSLLYALGKLSSSQEILSMIQTGRGVARLMQPLVVIGLFAALACLGFNYQWAPWARDYKDALIDQAKSGIASQEPIVAFYQEKGNRLWLIGNFPYEHSKGEPLRNVIVRKMTPEGKPIWRLGAKEARWDRETAAWTFDGVTLTHLDRPVEPGGPIMPVHKIPEGPVVYNDWAETPWRLIKPSLSAESLGIPDLYGLFRDNKADRRAITQWHYRWAQPGICLAIVLLAAPLGIVFSRRGSGGGVAVAIFLCAGMMFCSTVFLALGESGYLPPVWAAWGTNVAASVIALFLIQRRLSGRPIYQTFKKFLPN